MSWKWLVILINNMRELVVQSSAVLFLNVRTLPDISMNQHVDGLQMNRGEDEGKDERWVRKATTEICMADVSLSQYSCWNWGKSFLCVFMCRVFSHRETWLFQEGLVISYLFIAINGDKNSVKSGYILTFWHIKHTHLHTFLTCVVSLTVNIWLVEFRIEKKWRSCYKVTSNKPVSGLCKYTHTHILMSVYTE